MTNAELFDALDGLFAYDTGCVDSGIKDERLRQRVKAELKKNDPRIALFLKAYYLPPDYGEEDVAAFKEWLHEVMGVTS